MENPKVIVKVGGRFHKIDFPPDIRYINLQYLKWSEYGHNSGFFRYVAADEEKRLRELYPELAECISHDLSQDNEADPTKMIKVDFYPLRRLLCVELSKLSNIAKLLSNITEIMEKQVTTADIQRELGARVSSELMNIAIQYQQLERLTMPVPDVPSLAGLWVFKSDIKNALKNIKNLIDQNPQSPQR